jgi:hypothetical protein
VAGDASVVTAFSAIADLIPSRFVPSTIRISKLRRCGNRNGVVCAEWRHRRIAPAVVGRRHSSRPADHGPRRARSLSRPSACGGANGKPVTLTHRTGDAPARHQLITAGTGSTPSPSVTTMTPTARSVSPHGTGCSRFRSEARSRLSLGPITDVASRLARVAVCLGDEGRAMTAPVTLEGQLTASRWRTLRPPLILSLPEPLKPPYGLPAASCGIVCVKLCKWRSWLGWFRRLGAGGFSCAP